MPQIQLDLSKIKILGAGMKEISLGQLRPFVRFARLLDADIKKFPDLLCAGDCRLFYCTGGRGEIRAEGKSYEMQIGTLIYLAPGIPYSYFRDPEEPMKLLAFNFDLVWDRAELSVPFCRNITREDLANHNLHTTISRAIATCD